MRTEQAAGWDEFGREFRRLRERAGFTQAQLAARLGYDHTYLSKLENGVRAPRIGLVGQVDTLLGADGALLALAVHIRAQRSSTKKSGVSSGLTGPPLPVPARSGHPVRLPPVRRIQLPAFGVTCPLHDGAGCTLNDPPTCLADLLDDLPRTVGADTVHGFAALLTTYIEADLGALASELSALVEQTLSTLLTLVPKARGPIAAGLLHLAAQYADLAGWRRVQRGQHGIGMIWLQRSRQWALASHNFPTACEALGSMTMLALLEGDGATALEYGRAAEAVDRSRRWTVVQSKLEQARCHALLGDRREFGRHSREARLAAERLGERDRAEAPWLFGAEGETFIASHMAGALRDLADTTGDRAAAARAVAFAEISLANVPDRMPASRQMLTLRLADSQACSGDLDAAIALARPVMPPMEFAPIAPLRQELDRLRSRLGTRSGELLGGS